MLQKNVTKLLEDANYIAKRYKLKDRQWQTVQKSWGRTEIQPFTWSIPYKPRKGVFKASNNLFNPTDVTAYSYNHWCYVKVIKGKVVFNDYQYSATTRKHQINTKRLLAELGIHIDFVVSFRRSLESFDSEALPALYTSYYALKCATERKGTSKDKNKERKRSMAYLLKKMKIARQLGSNIDFYTIMSVRKQYNDMETRRLARLKAKKDAVCKPLNDISSISS